MQHHVRVVDLERADRAHVQVGEIARDFPVNPVFHFAVILSRRVRFAPSVSYAVPAVSLRDKNWVWFEVRVLRWIGEPLALVPDGVAVRYDRAVRIPVVAPLRSLASASKHTDR